MGCHTHNNCLDVTDCGCKTQTKGKCVFYQGVNLACIDATKGDTYDDILTNINSIICNLPTPSGTTYEGTTGEIVITGDVISLDSSITSAITNLQTANSQKSTCLATTVKDITSSTLNITTTNTTSCGRTLNLEYIAPNVPKVQGVVYNILSPISNVGNGFKRIHNLTGYTLANQDEIEIDLILKTINTSPIPLTDNLVTIYDGTTLLNGLSISDRGGLFFRSDCVAVYSNVKILVTIKNINTNLVNSKMSITSYGGIVDYGTTSAVSSKFLLRNDMTLPLSSIVVEFGNAFPSVTSLEQYSVSIKRKI